MDWLKETEELVSNQKAPSPDFKVAKAQLQEQKVILKMPNINTLIKLVHFNCISYMYAALTLKESLDVMDLRSFVSPKTRFNNHMI